MKTWQVGEECSQVFCRNALNVLEETCTTWLTREGKEARRRPVEENGREGSPFTGLSLGMRGQQQVPDFIHCPLQFPLLRAECIGAVLTHDGPPLSENV